MTERMHSSNNHATVQSELTYEQQVAARRARNQECFAQLGLSPLAPSFKDKFQQPVAPRKNRQLLSLFAKMTGVLESQPLHTGKNL